MIFNPEITSSTEVTLENKGSLTLREKDFVAAGGEAFVYRQGSHIVKLYKDATKMRSNGMIDKLKNLSTINHDFIVAPKGLVLSNNYPVGYYMDYVSGEYLSCAFTNSFWKRTNFDYSKASTLVDRMREVIKFAHTKKAVIIDPNELNWLLVFGKDGKPEPRIIDVDSWVVGPMPPTVAIMPSIKDWHNKGFDEMSDWFSWGVVTFQIYSGIHPYKGILDGFDNKDFEKRMKQNASVFRKDIKLNGAVRDFKNIPGPLLDWYFETFENGKRLIPPSPFDTKIVVTRVNKILQTVINTASGALIFEQLYKSDTNITRVFACGIILTDDKKIINITNKKQVSTANSDDFEIISIENGWLKAEIENKNINFTYIDRYNFKETKLNFSINSEKIICADNRLFAITDNGLTEISLTMFEKPVLSIGKIWGTMINSTKWFDGVGISNILGATHLVIPFGGDSCAQIRLKELDNIKTISAKAGKRFVTIIGLDKKGNYQKFEIVLDKDYRNYNITNILVDNPDLNISILPKGVCASIIDDGTLNIFVPSSGVINKVEDKDINTNMQLSNFDDQVIYFRDKELFSIRMKK